jgi:mxaJ protein
LARRGIVARVRAFTVYGDYADAAPHRAIVDAVARGELDVEFAWGPTAGYFAKDAQHELAIVPVTPWLDR